MKKIANIINFVRSVEPRAENDGFLFDTLRKELALCREYGFPSTVLLQYDALVKPEYQALVKAEPLAEPGLWLEVVGPQARDAGIPWRGRWDWDWDVRCSFLTGYTPAEREKLIDTAFGRFYEIFGRYPAAAGAWTVDAHSLSYMREKYGLAAFCNCKEQFGTDGITLWGGVPFGGYYPSKTNALLPAGTRENQIPLPVFRMLGADPIDQYDLGLGDPEKNQQVASLEPVYPLGGGSPRWVDWFLRETYGGRALSFAYAQFGQENSFGWEAISNGLPMQMQKLKEKALSGEVEVLTLGDTGRWFSGTYAVTPENVCAAAGDAAGQNRGTLWYASRFYRVNLYYERDALWVRDLQLYADSYAEPNLTEKNTDVRCGHFALPVTDGFRFSAGGVRAGIYPYLGAEPMRFSGAPEMRSLPPERAEVSWGDLRFTAAPGRFCAVCAKPGFCLRFRFADLPAVPYARVTPEALFMRFVDFTGRAFFYALRLGAGRFAETPEGIAVFPDARGEIAFVTEIE